MSSTISKFNQKLMEFLDQSPSTFHATATMVRALKAEGYVELSEQDSWRLKAGGQYYIIRGGSSLIAFSLARGRRSFDGFHMMGAHTDSPALKVRSNPERVKSGFGQLGVEVYGGAILNSWFDRDLSIAGHHSALYANPDNPSANDDVRLHYNGAGSVQPWLDAGVEPDKLVMGVPFYGRAWGGVGNTNNGLFQSGSSVPPGTWDDWSSGVTGVNDFFEIEEMLASGLYTRHWDDQAKVPWLYSVSQHGGHFVSYDDAESMQYKIDYVQDLNLGGVMFWEITGDRNETLLNVIYEGLIAP